MIEGTVVEGTVVEGTVIEGTVVEGEPKTERGKGTLPLDQGLADALTALRLRQGEAAGAAYRTCPDCGQGHVVVDEVGEPVHPESYSNRFEPAVG